MSSETEKSVERDRVTTGQLEQLLKLANDNRITGEIMQKFLQQFQQLPSVRTIKRMVREARNIAFKTPKDEKDTLEKARLFTKIAEASKSAKDLESARECARMYEEFAHSDTDRAKLCDVWIDIYNISNEIEDECHARGIALHTSDFEQRAINFAKLKSLADIRTAISFITHLDMSPTAKANVWAAIVKAAPEYALQAYEFVSQVFNNVSDETLVDISAALNLQHDFAKAEECFRHLNAFDAKLRARIEMARTGPAARRFDDSIKMRRAYMLMRTAVDVNPRTLARFATEIAEVAKDSPDISEARARANALFQVDLKAEFFTRIFAVTRSMSDFNEAQAAIRSFQVAGDDNYQAFFLIELAIAAIAVREADHQAVLAQ